MPRTELPATSPSANFLLYPCLSISGRETLLKTAAEATLTPVIAAKTAFAKTVATPSPPRILLVTKLKAV